MIAAGWSNSQMANLRQVLRIIMFGPHVNRVYAKRRRGVRPSITEHIRIAVANAATAHFTPRAVQIFVGNPHRRVITLTPEEASELKAYIHETKLWTVAHGSYLDSPWKGNAAATAHIDAEMGTCVSAGINGLVIHLGRPDHTAVVATLPLPRPEWKTARLYLETPHVKPKHSHYSHPSDYGALFRTIRAEVDPELQHYGLCIDTAHLWSCGVDIRARGAAEQWLQGLDAIAHIVPPAALLFHLNDSLDALGSGVDHHAPLGEGVMWSGIDANESGMAAFVEYAVRRGIPAILERKPPSKLLDDYRVLNELMQ